MIFPLPVIERAIDPVMGIPGAVTYPNLAKIRECLDKWHGEYLDDMKRRAPPPKRLEAPPEDPEMAKRVGAGLRELADQIGRGLGPSSV